MKKDNLKRDINLFEAIFKDKTSKARDMEKDIKTCIKIFVAVACICIVGFAGFIGFDIVSMQRYKALNQALSEEINEEDVRKLKNEVDSIKSQNEKLQEKLDEFKTLSNLRIDDIQNIAYEQPEGVTITSFEYNSGEFEILCKSSDELSGSYFAGNLRNSDRATYENVYCTSITPSDDGYLTTITFSIPENESSTEGGDK